MSEDPIGALRAKLVANAPQAHAALFPVPNNGLACANAWRSAVKALERGEGSVAPGTYGELASWLLWVRGFDAPLLRRIHFNARAASATTGDQFWSDDCTVMVARAMLLGVQARRQRARLKFLAEARARFETISSESAARWLRRLAVDSFGASMESVIPKLLAEAGVDLRGNGWIETGLLWLWFQNGEPLWPTELDWVLRRMVSLPRSTHAMFSGEYLLGALPKRRLRVLLEAVPLVHDDFLYLRNPASDATGRLSECSLRCGTVVHQNRAITDQLLALQSAPEASRNHLATHILAKKPSTDALVRGLRLVADETSVAALCVCLGLSKDISLEAARALGRIGPDAAEAALIEAFLMPKSSLPSNVARALLREGAVEVLRIWASDDLARVLGTILQFENILPRKSPLRSVLSGLAKGEGTSPWFVREAVFWHGLIRWLDESDESDGDQIFEGPDLIFDAFFNAMEKNSGHGSLEEIARAMPETPLVTVAVTALLERHAPRGWSATVDIAPAFAEILGDSVAEHLAHMIRYGPKTHLSRFYAHYNLLGPGDVRLHVFMLGQDDKRASEQAHKHLVAHMTPETMAELAPLLSHGKAAVRTRAIRCLGGSGKPEALPLLGKALLSEKASKVRPFIEQAIANCTLHADGEAPSMGSYAFGESADVNDILEKIRDLIHDPNPSSAQWVQLCDLLQRLVGTDGLTMAVDGLLKNSPATRHPHCFRPHHWEGHAELGSLGLDPTGSPWIPISAFADLLQRTAFLKRWLPEIEKGERRRIKADIGAQIFLHYTKASWAWCETHSLPLDGLALRVDGGKVGKMARSTRLTSFQLFQGFGVRILRDIAKRIRGGSRETGLTLLHMKVPKHHIARSSPALSKRISQGKINLLGEFPGFTP